MKKSHDQIILFTHLFARYSLAEQNSNSFNLFPPFLTPLIIQFLPFSIPFLFRDIIYIATSILNYQLFVINILKNTRNSGIHSSLLLTFSKIQTYFQILYLLQFQIPPTLLNFSKTHPIPDRKTVDLSLWIPKPPQNFKTSNYIPEYLTPLKFVPATSTDRNLQRGDLTIIHGPIARERVDAGEGGRGGGGRGRGRNAETRFSAKTVTLPDTSTRQPDNASPPLTHSSRLSQHRCRNEVFTGFWSPVRDPCSLSLLPIDPRVYPDGLVL